MTSIRLITSKPVLSWALYDWANSTFATTVMAGFFPIYFKQYWSGDTNASDSSYYLGIANSFASLILAFFAPYLGALADDSCKKKNYLGAFVALGVLCTGGLYFVGYGQWPIAALLYALATMGFAGGNIFYDALLPSISNKNNVDFISGFGFSLGYLGGGILFAFNVFMTLYPEVFGLSSPSQAVKVSFVLVSIWWFIFSAPLFLHVREPKESSRSLRRSSFYSSATQLWRTFKGFLNQKSTFAFLLAYLFYIDGVNTIIKMAVDYGLSLGFDTQNLITALLITQFVGFPAAILFGIIGEKFSPVKGIAIALAAYALITLWGYKMQNVGEFYVMAICVGLVQGGVQSLSRSHFSKMIPVGKEAEYFGFFNMIGKASAIAGPFLVGYVSVKTQNPRLSILVILIFFVIGAYLLFLHHKWASRSVTD